MLNFEQKDLLRRTIIALKPYSSLTDMLSGENTVTSSSIVEVLHILTDVVQDLTDGDGEPLELDADVETVKAMRRSILEYVNDRCVRLASHTMAVKLC